MYDSYDIIEFNSLNFKMHLATKSMAAKNLTIISWFTVLRVLESKIVKIIKCTFHCVCAPQFVGGKKTKNDSDRTLN